MRVPGADHSLSTWASDQSDEMFHNLFGLLDAQQGQQRVPRRRSYREM